MEPALDALWYKLDSFVPLVLCMPKDIYQEDVRPQEGELKEKVSLVSNGSVGLLPIFTPSIVVLSKVNARERLGKF